MSLVQLRRAQQHRRGADDGASAVEFALLLPVAVMLTLGTITGAQAYADKLSLTQAAREGSRYGATLPVSGPGRNIDLWLADVQAATENAAQDHFAPGQDSSRLCVAFVNGNDSSLSKRLIRAPDGSVTSTAGATCFTDTLTDNRVQVEISRQVSLNIGLYSWNPQISSRALTHAERGT
jgi:Flp pilus assembly protein TadG